MPDVIASAHAITTPEKSTKRVSLPVPLPCITILVHGVNDVGEAYDAQERGLCKGLNARLDRAHKLAMNACGDLVPASYRMPEFNDSGFVADGVKADPDAVYFRRAPARTTWSPVIPFYWGLREEEGHIKKDNWHGQWTDRYGNRLDKNGAKNGGPFANATTTLNAMWGDGFSGKIGGAEMFADAASSPLHNLKKAAPRHYMLLAAQRLAMLIKMIRNRKGFEYVAINILCHSQGSMVALTAHALLADERKKKYTADTLILQDPPYSLEEPFLEYHDGVTGSGQQTTVSRIKTLSNIVRYIQTNSPHTPDLKDLEFLDERSQAVAGPHWKSGAGSRQWSMGEIHTFTERDNRGKVYLYFSQDDATVALKSVQGIGWQGVPDNIRTTEIDPISGKRISTLIPVLYKLGEGFRQRVFTARQLSGQPVMVGRPPGRYEMRSKDGVLLLTDEKSTTGDMSVSVKQIERGAVRLINGEELHPPIVPIMNIGEAGHRKKLGASPIDAAIAIAAGEEAIATSTTLILEFRNDERRGKSPLTDAEKNMLEERLPNQRRGTKLQNDDRLRLLQVMRVDSNGIFCTYSTETANEARARWQNHMTDDNSYHSAIPANPAHTAGVTAYDVSIGTPLPCSNEDNSYLTYLCAVADWRTDWKLIGTVKDDPVKTKILEHYDAEGTDGAKRLIDANFSYHQSGVLPSSIIKDGIVQLDRPSLIDHETVDNRRWDNFLFTK